MKFYKCKDCGSIVILENACCAAGMEELLPNTTDAAGEKHVPVITVDGAQVCVAVGSVEHPMLPAHFIQWVVLETTNGYQKKVLQPEQKPVAQFVLAEGEEAVAAYEFCNLHGLWKAEA
ncbi:MAG: desulfoferrodoxin [Oscillospiraceae bacterium]|nr:desulfoferrodoxin [Oscillospiraceae bacterium]